MAETGRPPRVSNGRVTGVIAVITLVLTIVIVSFGPTVAESISGPASSSGRVSGGASATIVVPGVPKPIPMIVPAKGEMVAPAIAVPEGPTLPAPGVEQPADPDGARAAILAAMETLWGGENPREVRLSVLDDPTNLDATMDEVRARYEEASASTVPELGDVVFTDASNASFLFRLRYVGAPLLPTRIGTARLIDGRWLITRATLCEVLSQGGSTCPPGAGSS